MGLSAFGGLAGSVSPISGALAGLAKTAGQEWKAVNCKAIDIDAAFDVPEGAARVIVDELHKRGPDEIGLTRQGRNRITLEYERKHADVFTSAVGLVAGRRRRRSAVVLEASPRKWPSPWRRHFSLGWSCSGARPCRARKKAWLAGIDDEAGMKRALAARSVATA